MVNSPVASTADSASDWSSPGVAQPPRIPSRSLFTIPPGVVKHPQCRADATVRFASVFASLRAKRGRVRRRVGRGIRVAPGPSLITTSAMTAGPSAPPHGSAPSHLAQKRRTHASRELTNRAIVVNKPGTTRGKSFPKVQLRTDVESAMLGDARSVHPARRTEQSGLGVRGLSHHVLPVAVGAPERDPVGERGQ